MEKADVSSDSENQGQNFQTLGLALQQFDTALQFSPGTKEAIYNRALCLQRMKAFAEAKKAWEQYLQADSTSPWAAEARAALKALSSVNNSSAADVLTAFLSAHEHHDDNQAWTVLRQTREVVTGRMIPFQLINQYLKNITSGDDEGSARMLAELNYAGRLELERSGDPYVARLADYYAQLRPTQRKELVQAQRLFSAGLGAYAKSRYEDAYDYFRQARQGFHSALDVAEENLVIYWIANCEAQKDHLKLSADELEALVKFSQAHNYKWLNGQALWLLASNRFQLGEYSRSIEVD
jgi:tetratricopeptide (TPR) repeat protein